MRICFIWSYRVAGDGVRTWLGQCLRDLPTHGVDAYVLNLAREQVPLYENVGVAERIKHVPINKWDSEYSLRRRLRKFIDDLKPDLLVFNEQFHAEDCLAATKFSIPAVNVVHSDRATAYPIMVELANRNVIQLCVSRQIYDSLIRWPGLTCPDSIQYRLLGVDCLDSAVPCAYAGEDDVLRFCYVGRLRQEQKRVMDIPILLEELARLNMNFKFVIAGEGRDSPELKTELDRRSLAKYVDWLGAVPHDQALKIMSESHVFFLCSEYEGLPLSLLEAMARGVLPIVSDIPSGISEVVEHGQNGFCFPLGNLKTAAMLVGQVAQRPQHFLEMRYAAMHTARNYSFERCLVEFVKQFRRASDSTPAPGISKSQKAGIGHFLAPYLPFKWHEWRCSRTNRHLDSQ